ncbi:MAG: hypothetical protein GY816_17080 [Cytophagales bacterium]|nr:hypothetical protein [Cytophagales bacterium]
MKPAKYDEDLSVHRPSLGETIGLSTRRTEPTVIPEGHIKMELDSISNMISRENTKPRIEQGFTILLYNGSNRENATRALGRIRMRFPEIKAKMTYFQPDFKVKAGRFVDRIMAYETYERVRKNFPEALLIPEKIRINYD